MFTCFVSLFIFFRFAVDFLLRLGVLSRVTPTCSLPSFPLNKNLLYERKAELNIFKGDKGETKGDSDRLFIDVALNEMGYVCELLSDNEHGAFLLHFLIITG